MESERKAKAATAPADSPRRLTQRIRTSRAGFKLLGRDILVIGDSHASPGESNHRFTWLGRFLVEHQPAIVVDIGDWWSMDSLCSFEEKKNPRDYHNQSYMEDIQAGIDGMKRVQYELDSYNKGRRNKYKPELIRTLGNHEYRIVRLIKAEPGLDGKLGLADLRSSEFGWREYGYGDPVEIAGFLFCHHAPQPGMGPEKDLETVALMREAVGPGAGLMIDAHTWWRMGDNSYSFETIANLARDIAEYDPLWVEEPLPPDDHDAYQKLRAQSNVKLASGEHEPNDAGFADLIDSGAVDYVQMDILCQGGISSARRIFEGVAERGLRFAFHSWGTALEVLAAAQLGVCWPEDVVEWLEYPCYSHRERPAMYPFPLADEILSEALEIEDGYLILPDGSGMGIDINETVIEKYPFIPGPWSIFELDSPAQTVAVTGDHSLKWVKGKTQ